MRDEREVGIPVHQLIPGVRYRVTFGDCCIEGWFDGRFIEVVTCDDDEPFGDPEFDGARFDTGQIGPGWSVKWVVEEIPLS